VVRRPGDVDGEPAPHTHDMPHWRCTDGGSWTIDWHGHRLRVVECGDGTYMAFVDGPVAKEGRKVPRIEKLADAQRFALSKIGWELNVDGSYSVAVPKG
jgi:hypothetical protein